MAYIVSLVVSLFCTTSEGAGLIDISKMLSGQDINQIDGLDLKNATGENSSQLGPKSFIDNSLDPDSYYIGMGDEFTIAVLEMPSTTYSATVNQQCDIYISELGLIRLGKIPLRKAIGDITSFVKNKLKNRYTIYVSLSEGKKVSVSVNGYVQNPGTYIMDGIMRIEDCILKANKSELPPIDEVDLRNVIVQKPDTTLYLDLLKYNLTNDLSQNPYIYPGDHIFVKPISRRVYIMGEIAKPHEGFFPTKEDERLSDILPLLSLTSAADLSHIVVQDGSTNNTRTTKVYSTETSGSCTLNDMDIISFTPKMNYPQHITVSVSGAVNRPGIYPAVHSVTRVEDIISLAGGFRDNADSVRGYIIRAEKAIHDVSKIDEEDKVTIKKPPITTPGSIRPELNLSFSRLNSFQDYTLLPMTGDISSFHLESGDEVFIPFNESFVYVSGCVNKPGAYPFIVGKNKNFYISEAGGFSDKSDQSNTYIISRVKTVLQIRDGKTVQPGDIVVIPDSQNNKLMITMIIPLVQIISTAVTVFIAIISLNK